MPVQNKFKDKIIAVVCARAGSRGIKKKNLIKINNKPLIYFAVNKIIENRLRFNCISTNSSEINKTSKKFGINSFFLRPKKISSSNVAKLEVWKHALKESEKFYKKKFEYFLDIEVTNPLITPKDLKIFLNKFKKLKGKFDGMFCVRNSWKNPYFNILRYKNKRFSTAIKHSKKIVSRQMAPQTFDHVAAMYIFKSDYIRKTKNFLDGKLFPYKIPLNKSIDIDTYDDYSLVRKLMKK
jgi:CMP-N-acetylneuraminic acid synthetase